MSMHKFYKNKFIWIITFYMVFIVITFIYLRLLCGDWSNLFWIAFGTYLYCFVAVPDVILTFIFLIREIIFLHRISLFSIIALIPGSVQLWVIILSQFLKQSVSIEIPIYCSFTAIMWLCWIGEYVDYKINSRKEKRSDEKREWK